MESPRPSLLRIEEAASGVPRHRRFARAVVLIYLGAAIVAVSLVLAALVTDRTHEEDTLRNQLALRTQLRASYLARHLALLASELRRLSLRSEVDLLDAPRGGKRRLCQ